ncbi:MAG: hypothetical protein H7257_00740 [Taibaiella sp.]|nr:hypothetical protein [Taibaiella sp.]
MMKKANIVILMLTTSAKPADLKRVQEIEDITGYKTKPLLGEMQNDILEKYFTYYM